jgi:hypothetical protein
MITKASECSLRVFMKCLFEDDQSDVDNFELIWSEYVDLSGLCENREKEILVSIHNIKVRQSVIPALIKFQLDYIERFKEPYLEAFWIFKKYGHQVIWNSDAEELARQLERVRLKELQYESQLDMIERELQDLKKEGVKIDGNGRKEFIRLLNDVGKYRRNDIDRDRTDVETFAIMVRDYLDRPAKQN